MITTTVFQARGSQQDCSGGNRRTQEAEVWRDRGWRLCDGPPGTPGQVQDEESSPEGRHVHDGAGEETQALRPALQMLLQLVVSLFQAEGRSQKVLRYKFYQILSVRNQ